MSSPVVSLTLIDATTAEPRITARSKMLVAVRSPEANATHPNVVSVPTMRVPQRLFDDIANAKMVGATGGTTFFDGEEVDSAVMTGHHPVIFAVEALLTRKLNLATALEKGEAQYTARLACITHGVAVYRIRRDRFDVRGAVPVLVDREATSEEPIAMANIHVRLKGLVAPQFPRGFPSYTRAAWVDVDSFMRAAATHDQRLLDEEDGTFSDAGFTLEGVCVDSTAAGLARELASER